MRSGTGRSGAFNIQQGSTGAAVKLGVGCVPMISVSSGTMGNNGALSAITALGRTVPNCYLYLPASAISAGSAAGWYFAQMSSTTAGTVFNNVYTTGVPTIPASPTAFVTTGPGAFVGDTTEQGVTISVPANALGVNGMIRVHATWSENGTATNKTHRIRYSGSAGTAHINNAFNSTLAVDAMLAIHNQGVTNSQIASGQINSASFGFIFSTGGTADTTAATSVFISVQKATATDNHAIELFSVEYLS